MTRKQAEERNLPEAFKPDDKKYQEGLKQRFYRESGGKTCIELDALSEKDIVHQLEKNLEKYANLEKDEKEYQELRNTVDGIMENLDLSQYEGEYNRLKREYGELAREVGKFKRTIDKKEGEMWKRKNRLKSKVKGELKEKLRKRVGDKKVLSSFLV